jgi:hypothetical protein
VSESGIAQAAAHAELQHLGWEEVDFGHVRKTFSYGAMGHVRTTITVHTYTGSWEAETSGGEPPDSMVETWVKGAQDVIKKWPPKIERVFSKWRDIPNEWDFWEETWGLDHATKELTLSPDEDAEGSLEFGNTRLAADLDNLRLRTGDLNGTYAEKFRENYVAYLQPTIANQGAVVALLAVATHTMESLWGKTYVDLVDLEYKAEKAMEASAPSGDSGTDALVVGLTVVAAVAAGVAAVATAGGSVAVAAALVGGGTSAAGSLLSHFSDEPEPKKIPLGADHPDKVFTKLEEALEDLDSEIEAQERDLVTLLSAGHELTTVKIPYSDLRLKRSGITNAAPGEVLDSQQLVTVDGETIAKITELWLPTIVGDLRSAREELDAKVAPWRRPSGIGLEPTGAWPQFRDLQSAMVEVIGATASELEGAASALQEAARGIGLSDEEANRRFDRKADKIIEKDI